MIKNVVEYHVWAKVPPDLLTKNQLRKEGLVLREGEKPVAFKRNTLYANVSYSLYRRDQAHPT